MPMDERTPAQTTFRVMGPHERGRFAPEAWGHLLSLSGSGAINGPEPEHIIERALMQFEGRIALDDLRGMLEGTGLEDSSGAGDNTTVQYRWRKPTQIEATAHRQRAAPAA